MVADIRQGHSLGLRLAKRNIKSMYRQSLLGYFWSVVPPLITSLVWIFLNSQNIVSVKDPGIPYPLFVLTGTFLWQIFAESVMAPLSGTSTGKSILTKINFPRESLVFSGIYEVLFNLMIKFALLTAIFIWFSNYPGPVAILSILGILSLILLGSGIGIILAPVSMLYKDIRQGLRVFLQFAIYLTPVIYIKPKTGLAAKMMAYNPVAPLLSDTRNLLTGTAEILSHQFMIVSIVSLFLFMIGLVLYRISLPVIIERIGS